MPPDVVAYLRRVCERIEEAFGADLVGVYLLGSLALGGYLPGRSDIDVAVVVGGRHARSGPSALAEALDDAELPCPARKLELVVYPDDALRGPLASLHWLLNLNTGSGIGLRVSEDPRSAPRHWFVLDVAIAKEHARPLVGIPPSLVFPELERVRVLDAVRASLDWHHEHDRAGVDAVLNACRGLRFAETGDWVSKDDAAAWGRAEGPDPELVTAALDARHGRLVASLPADQVDAFLGSVRERIGRGPGCS